MRSIWKVLTGLLALSLVLAAAVWTAPDGQVPGAGAAVRSAGSAVQMDSGDPKGVGTEVYVSEPSVPTISRAARDLPEPVIDPLLDREMARRNNFGLIGEGVQGPAWLDPLVENQRRTILAAPDAFTTPLTNWAGMDYNSYPPDTTGDVGPNHYLQAVNGSGGSTVQIFNKSGTILKTFAMETLSSTAPCNSGYCDPIVIYDALADRWLITEFSTSSSNPMCIYVSTTADPTGTWYAYSFDLTGYDYPKYGVWPDAYYMGYNGGTTGYRQVFAFDRARMLAGQPATYQMFSAPSLSGLGFQLLVPASWEGPTPPPSGLGGLFARPNDTEVNGPAGYASTDFLEMYEFDVDWTTPANSRLTRLPDVAIGEYDCTLCGTGSDWSCMPQPGTTQALDPIREPLHQPLQYRNWGSYETLVGGFAEDVDGTDKAAVRWFELRRVSGAWSAYQEGVVGGGDTHHRSVTSVAMDGSGGIGLGYTLTSSTVYPSIRYAGRRSWDPLGSMAYVDAVAWNGDSSQTSYDRWGDYSGIGVDPADDCTFWFTTEYMSGGSSATRVISFRHDADFSPDASPNSLTVCQPTDAVYTVQAAATCAWTGDVTMSASGLPAGVTESWSANPVTPPSSTTLTIGNTGAAAVGSYNVTITGASGSTTRSETVVLNLQAGDLLGATTLSLPANGSTGAGTTPTLTWQALAGASSYNIEVATDPGFINVVRSAAGLTATSYTVSPALSQDTVYYWRVTGGNACGAGTASTIWAFRTAATGCITYASTDVPQTIPDRSTAYSTLTVPDSFTITDVNVTIGEIIHTYDGDLDIYIQHPDTTEITLSTDNGSSGANYVNTVFDDEAATAITAGSAPFTGSFRPEGILSTFDNKPSTGADPWRLRIYDDSRNDTGVLNSWSLTLCGAPAPAADYSDLASSYGVAWHTGDGVLKLGPTWDADTTFGPGADTDDGVTFMGSFIAGQNATVRVNVQGTPTSGRWLRLWFDWNGNGVFDTDEQMYSGTVNSGDNDLAVLVPASLTSIVKYRARLYDSASGALALDAIDAISYDGAAGGEVEDGESPQPLAVDLAFFSAAAAADGVTLAWETVSETDNAGFNVYRADSSLVADDAGSSEADPLRMTGWVRLNAALIPAAAPGSSQGNSYTWTDATAGPGATYWYRLEDVALDGTLTRHAPVAVTVAAPNAVGLAGPLVVATSVADPALAGLAALALAALAGAAARKRR